MAIFSFIPDLFKEGFKTVTHVVNSLDELKNVIVQNIPRMFDQTLQIELRNKGADFDFTVGVNTHKVHASDKDGDRLLVGTISVPKPEIQPIAIPVMPENMTPNISIPKGEWKKI
jgi:hypothetical protein